MTVVDKLRKVIASAVMVGLVGIGTSIVTVVQQPDPDGIVTFSLTYVIFSNGVIVWLGLGLIKKERTGRLAYTVGDVVLGPLNDVSPVAATAKVKGTLGAMVLVSGFLAVFISGVPNADILSFLGTAYDAVTRGLTLAYWLPLQYLWDGAPVSLGRLLEANHQGAGSLAAAAAVLLGELIDAVGVGDPSELLE